MGGSHTGRMDTDKTTPVQRLLDERIVLLGSEVTDEVANDICAQLLLLDSIAPDRDIFLYINSPGGSVTAGFAIFDTLNFVKADVATLALGFAASMGQFLLSSGKRGKRYALPNASVVMHQPHGGFGGTSAGMPDPGEADPALQTAHGRAHQRADRPTGDADHRRRRPRPLVHRG